MKDFNLQIQKRVVEVELERFEKTDLEIELDKFFGKESDTQLIYNDIEKTYKKYLFKYGTRYITILTDLVEEGVYEFGANKVNIKNKSIQVNQ